MEDIPLGLLILYALILAQSLAITYKMIKDKVKSKEIKKKEENKMNKYVKMLMEDLGVKVGELFNIKTSNCNPYHFSEKGKLRDCNGVHSTGELLKLMNEGKDVIEKIEVLPKLTEQEVGMLKAFKIMGYKYIARNENDILFVYSNSNLRSIIIDGSFNTIKMNYAYTIDELLETNKVDEKK